MTASLQSHVSQNIQTLCQQKEALVDVIRFLHSRHWTPATSSNFSCRALNDPEKVSISVSGLDKGSLTIDDFLDVDLLGNVIGSEQPDAKPSAETVLHLIIYKRFPQVTTVLHVHSVNATVLSLLDQAQNKLQLQGFEMLKAFEGIKHHDTVLDVPIYPNSQDMSALSQLIEADLASRQDPLHGFLLAGHGLYAWGETPAQAKRHVEAFEFLFDCVLKLRSYGHTVYS